jgi:hypothetical protein
MPRDDEFYPLWIVHALRHVRYWMRKVGLTVEQRRAVWLALARSEK